MLTYPIIFVPGITASSLRDLYSLPPEQVWATFSKEYRRVSLHPNDLRYESAQPAMIKPDQVFEVAYKELIHELREEFLDICGNEVPVYPFAYDWRQPLEIAQQQLADFIQEVIERTKLLPHYRKHYGEDLKVNLIGHSMGGLVISRCLTDQSKKLPINKVSTLATPFQGSFESIVKLTVGAGNLGQGKPSHAERRAARVTPALYQLLPGFKAGITIDPAFPQHLFDAKTWQPSVVTSLTKYVKETALPGTKPKETAEKIFSDLLALAKNHHQKMKKLKLSTHGLNDNDWLTIVGVDSKTRIRQEINKSQGKPVYQFDHKVDVKNRWKDKNPPDDWRLTGDGTVPFEGAVPPFLSEDKLVLISPDDYGFWELSDKALTEFGGFHGILPNMNLIQRILLRFFTGKTDKYKNTWGRAVPGVAQWNPPIKLKRKN